MKIQRANISVISLFLLYGVCGLVLFHFFGNAVRGWIDTPSVFVWWGSQWLNPDCEAQHGPLVALLSVWLFFRGIKCNAQHSSEPRISMGIAILFIGCIVHVFGYLIQHTRVSIVAFLIYLIAGAFLFGGQRAGRASLFPCILMLFSIPLQVLFDEFSYPLRVAVIDATHWLSSMVGFGVVREGTMLFSADGSYRYDVAPACSGLRSLMAIVSLTLLVGHLSFRNIWPQALLFFLAFLFAYIGNVVRLFSIIVVAEAWGQDAGGKAHDYGGFIVFVFVLGLSLAFVSLLLRWKPELAFKSAAHEKGETAFRWGAWTPRGIMVSASCVLFLSIASGFAIYQVERKVVTNACGVLLAEDNVNPVPLPNVLNFDWMGKHVPVSEIELATLPSDTGFSRAIYQNLSGDQVFVSVVLSGKDRTSIHRPEICLHAQGWTIVGKRKHIFEMPPEFGGQLETTLLSIERTLESGEVVEGLFSYWFIAEDVVVATHGERVLWGFLDRVLKFKSNRWAYVFGQTIIQSDEETGLKHLQEVIELVIPKFKKEDVHPPEIAQR